MAKRTFLQLCHVYKGQEIGGWYLSEKLDGQRAFWDGGISRGLPAATVPYANTVKDARLIEESIATGLWSRMGKVIHAPDWWLNQLPAIPLDGELYLDRGLNQEMASIVRSHNGSDWSDIRYMILDSPSYPTIFEDGQIELRFGNEKYYLYFEKVMQWVEERAKKLRIQAVQPDASYYIVHRWLEKQFNEAWDKGKFEGKAPFAENKDGNWLIQLHHQERLEHQRDKIQETVDYWFDKVTAEGGEGLVVRSYVMPWLAERSHYCLKMKPDSDSEAQVIGYTWGKEGKYLGMMGNMLVSWQGVRFELSGFTDQERQMSCLLPSIVEEERIKNPGKVINGNWTNNSFPIGSYVTFKYRELTRDGVPKEARYYRRRVEE